MREWGRGAEWNVYPNSKPSPLNGSSFPHSPSLLKATRRWWWWRRKRRRVDWQPSPPIAKRIAVSSECPAPGIAQLGEGTVTLVLREHGDFSHFNDGSLLGPQYRLWLSLSHTRTHPLPTPLHRTLCIQKPTCSCYGFPPLIFFADPPGAGAAKSTLAPHTSTNLIPPP